MHAAPATVCFIIVSILKSVVLFEPSSAGCVEERSACQYGIHITATSAAESITAPCIYVHAFFQSIVNNNACDCSDMCERPSGRRAQQRRAWHKYSCHTSYDRFANEIISCIYKRTYTYIRTYIHTYVRTYIHLVSQEKFSMFGILTRFDLTQKSFTHMCTKYRSITSLSW